MSNETREHLSCLMDGELSSDAGRFLARRMGGDEQLCDTWQRYHLIRDCLRRPGEALVLTQLSVDLEAAEPVAPASGSGRRPGMPGWMRPVTGGAIAASVAAAAVFIAVNLQAPTQGPVAEPFTSPNPARLKARASQPASFNPASAAGQRSLNRYLMRHNQAAGTMGQKGFLPYIPVVAGTAAVTVVEAEAETPEAADTATETNRDEP